MYTNDLVTYARSMAYFRDICQYVSHMHHLHNISLLMALNKIHELHNSSP